MMLHTDQIRYVKLVDIGEVLLAVAFFCLKSSSKRDTTDQHTYDADQTGLDQFLESALLFVHCYFLLYIVR